MRGGRSGVRSTFHDQSAAGAVVPATVLLGIVMFGLYLADLMTPLTVLGATAAVGTGAVILGRPITVGLDGEYVWWRRGSTERRIGLDEIDRVELVWAPELDEYLVIGSGPTEIAVHELGDRSAGFRRELGNAVVQSRPRLVLSRRVRTLLSIDD